MIFIGSKEGLDAANIQYRTAEEIGNIMGAALAGFLVNGLMYLFSLLFMAYTMYTFTKEKKATAEEEKALKKNLIYKICSRRYCSWVHYYLLLYTIYSLYLPYTVPPFR